MKIFKAGFASLFALTAFASLGNASSLSYNNLDSYAIWDTFSAAQFADVAPELESNTIFSATLTATGGGAVTGGGDRIYGGNRGDDYSLNFTIDGTAHADITDFYLSIAFSEPNPSANPPLTWTNAFTTVSLNGVEGTPAFLRLTGETIGSAPNVQSIGIVQWHWTGLSIAENDLFSLSIQSPVRLGVSAAHLSIDSFSVTNIPEPSTWALLAFGGIAITLTMRRRMRAFSQK